MTFGGVAPQWFLPELFGLHIFVQMAVERRLDEPCGGQNGNV